MTHSQKWFESSRAVLTFLTTLTILTSLTLVGASPSHAAQDLSRLASGVVYEQLDEEAEHGPVRLHLLRVDLRSPHVHLELLYPGAVAARAPVSAMADARTAVGGVNGDFFNITEAQHPGVEATGASVGPAVAEGRVLKAAVPNGQRFGPALPPGASTEDVVGVGKDRRARLDRLQLEGTVTTGEGTLPLGGLNQYALPVDAVGAFTHDWGSVSRVRATCGTDTERAAPCSTDTFEVTVRDGRVTATADRPGSGPIDAHTVVLVGREAGAQQLRKFYEGERVTVRHRLLASASRIPYRFTLGGYPVLRAGQIVPGLDTTASAVRTAVGITAGGRQVLLLALDGAAEYRTGMTIAEMAGTLRDLGATDGFSLDGGGSSTLVARDPGATVVTVRNHPTGGAERPVPNGIGVFSTG
ncbi:hypothetical protein AQJ23_43190 [Streptomyces antibioticus]|nr:phosphodiester glycosidase family protein [Streptomyces antibioticus]KUN16971.1 hypothetical protein AQJ23_43190 [Streptomyces antibioticus]